MSIQVHDHYFATQDNIQLFYRVIEPQSSETAPTVLCLPGLTRNHRDFDALAQILGHKFRLICPDLRGRGHSEFDPDTTNYHLETYLNDLLQLLAAEDVGEFSVIGTSLGGILAMILAQFFPGLLKSVVLNDVGGYVPEAAMAAIAKYVQAAGPESAWSDATDTIKQNFQAAFTDLDEAQWLAMAKRLYIEAKDGSILPDYDLALKQMVQVTEIDLWPQFDNLKEVPTLLVRGQNSELLSENTVAEMLAVKPDMQWFEVPNRGHAPFLDEAIAVEHIQAFLDKHGH